MRRKEYDSSGLGISIKWAVTTSNFKCGATQDNRDILFIQFLSSFSTASFTIFSQFKWAECYIFWITELLSIIGRWELKISNFHLRSSSYHNKFWECGTSDSMISSWKPCRFVQWFMLLGCHKSFSTCLTWYLPSKTKGLHIWPILATSWTLFWSWLDCFIFSLPTEAGVGILSLET